MPFTIVRNDITRMQVDAIVNSAAPHLLGGGGADGAIHQAAGPELKEACRALGGCKPGQVKHTLGYNLPCRYVFHTVGPVWMGGVMGEEEKLRSCYRNALHLAREMALESIAFPLISSGIFAFPRDRALRVAMDEIRDFVLEHDLMVYLVVYDPESFRISARLQKEITQYIDDRYVQEHEETELLNLDWDEEWIGAPQASMAQERSFTAFREAEPIFDGCADSHLMPQVGEGEAMPSEPLPSTGFDDDWQAHTQPCLAVRPKETAAPVFNDEMEAKLRHLLAMQDESFTQRLLRLIDESGMSDPECYRRANIDRRLFSKIRNNAHYQPTKQTVLAFAVALRLSRPDTDALLQTAGLALSHSNKFDLVVEYFIKEGIYDVMQINEALYAFDLPLLGN